MPQLRKDPVTGTWVVIAEERARRPSDFNHERVLDNSAATCPFCPGREDQTPREVFALRDHGEANASGWDVRVVPNKFPALSPEGGLDSQHQGIYQSMNGVGVHEVIVDSPDHVQTLADLPEVHVQKVIQTYVARLKTAYENEQCVYAQLFKNDGKEAGASLAHPHTQLVGLPLLPSRIERELSNASAFFSDQGQSVFEMMLNETLEDEQRLVMVNDHFIAFAPFASRFPYEVHLMPRFGASDFSKLDASKWNPLGQILKSVLRRLKVLLNNPPFNFFLHTAPNANALKLDDGVRSAFRWHIEITPRLSMTAGFEWGSGTFINPTPPELTASLLRNLLLD